MSDSSGFIPYGKQLIDDEDVAAVVKVLRSDWLTTGPEVKVFEDAVAKYCTASHAVAVSSGTAGLHAALFAIGIGSGDEVIVPPLTFAATANAALYLGAKVVFADIKASTLQIDSAEVEKKITARTKAIIAVDYAGMPCDYPALRKIADRHKIKIVADACHSIGGSLNGEQVGTLADLSVLSFHPVKQMTTGEGGMVVTDSEEFAARARIFRNHGITTDHRQRAETGTIAYEMTELGFNYRITDFQCALGGSQLKKLPLWIERRQLIAKRYEEGFSSNSLIELQGNLSGASHAYHLFVLKLDVKKLGISRDQVAKRLRELGIGVNVHYPPLHLHPYYRKQFGHKPGEYPVTESAYERIMSIPMYHGMSNSDVERVISSINQVVS